VNRRRTRAVERTDTALSHGTAAHRNHVRRQKGKGSSVTPLTLKQMIDPKVRASWLKLATPEILGGNLIRASLFLVAWEILKGSIIGKPLGFFATEFKDGNWQPSPKYKEVVLSLDRNVLMASCLWFKSMEALTDDDIRKLQEAREYRNQIAHNLLEFLGNYDKELEDKHLQVVQELLVKVDRWWVREIEIPTNPDFDGQEIPDEEISSGNMLVLAMIFDVVSGKQDYREFLEKMEAPGGGN
jgi:hypothetical protein